MVIRRYPRLRLRILRLCRVGRVALATSRVAASHSHSATNDMCLGPTAQPIRILRPLRRRVARACRACGKRVAPPPSRRPRVTQPCRVRILLRQVGDPPRRRVAANWHGDQTTLPSLLRSAGCSGKNTSHSHTHIHTHKFADICYVYVYAYICSCLRYVIPGEAVYDA